MNDKDKNYTFDKETEDNEIAEYLERDLQELDSDLQDKSDKGRKRNKSIRRGRENGVSVFYKKNKMQVLWSVFGVLVIILIIALIVTNTGKKSEPDDNQADDSKYIEQETTTEQESEEEDVLLAEASDSEYNKLLEKYFQNSVVEWNEAALSECYENMQNVSKENYSYFNKYVEAVENIVCYVVDEPEDGKELVCVTYNMKFKNVNTAAPFMEVVSVVKTDGGYKLHNFEVGEELDVYTNKVQENPKYKELITNINNQFNMALESDADLKKICNALQNVISND